MGITEQQHLMSIIKDAEIEVCRKESVESNPEPIATDIVCDNGRLRSRIQIAESEANEWRRLFEEQSTKVLAEMTIRNEECRRLKQQLVSVQDELDIAKEQSNRIPGLEQTIQK